MTNGSYQKTIGNNHKQLELLIFRTDRIEFIHYSYKIEYRSVVGDIKTFVYS